MSLIAGMLREEAVDALTQTILDVVARLSPTTRLRLLAFMHLIDQPDAILADLNVDRDGYLSLTLSHPSNVGD